MRTYILAQDLAADASVKPAVTCQEAGAKGGRGRKAVTMGHCLSSVGPNTAERISAGSSAMHPRSPQRWRAVCFIMKMPPQITLRRHRARSTSPAFVAGSV